MIDLLCILGGLGMMLAVLALLGLAFPERLWR